MAFNYLSVTEIAGDEVTQEQVQRLCHRYYWAGKYCKNKDVLEVACGTGQGLGYLSEVSKSIKAGDYSEKILKIAGSHYGNRIELRQFDAQDIPYKDNSFDIIIIFEALYYIPSADKFVKECNRLLQRGGKVLLATANKDLYDFNPSPHSYKYYGIIELNELFSSNGFSIKCYGSTPIGSVSFRQKILRPIKKLVISLRLMPKSMKGKKLLKKLVFGKMVTMPKEIDRNTSGYIEPVELPLTQPDKNYKVIYCEATLSDK